MEPLPPIKSKNETFTPVCSCGADKFAIVKAKGQKILGCLMVCSECDYAAP